MMFSRNIVFLFLSSLVAKSAIAQTASCNPLSATSSCAADPALATSFSEDFHTNSTYFDAYAHSERIEYTDDGVKITLAKRYDNPSLKSNFYIMFGRLEVQFKAATGQGIVSSFYLQSDDLDEIDLEWIGGDTTQVQTNYFSKGNTTTYTRGEFHSVSEPQEEFHNYTIDWTEDNCKFYIDDDLVRTIDSDSSEGYPQSPMYVVTGIWAGGDEDNSAGTIEWAGGLTNYSAAPFSMYVKSLIVSDYSTGSEYVYSDTSGDWSSIEAVDGEVNGRYEEGVEEFSILSAGGSVSGSSSSYSAGLSSSYSRHSTAINSGSSTSSLNTRSLSSTSQGSSLTSDIATVVGDSTSQGSSFTSDTATVVGDSTSQGSSFISDTTTVLVSSGSSSSTTSNGSTSSDSGSLDSSSSASALRAMPAFGFGSIGLNAIVVSSILSCALLLAL